MDRGKNIIQEESANLGSNPLVSNYQRGSGNDLLLDMESLTSPLGAAPSASIPHMDWNPDTMLDNLSFIEAKIRQVKDVIRSMAGSGGQLWTTPGELMMQQQQQVNADLTCLIVQLISTAGSLLPSLKNSSFLSHPHPPPGGKMANFAGTSSGSDPNAAAVSDHQKEELLSPDYGEFLEGLTDGAAVEGGAVVVKDQDGNNEDGEAGMDGDGSLPPGSYYELLQLEEDEILAPHTHFCAICGKGFKRDANRRMHMRGHGDEYKSPAALAKPPASADKDDAAAVVKRYSCPFAGCKRNRLHKSFLPLKTILCVKNHYKRSHCEKSHTCSRCHAKKFSVLADLKTHEKHCGQVRWLCSCGTTFSRKDKLFAHVGLFKQGHTPLLPADEPPQALVDAGGHQEPAKDDETSSMGSSFMWGDSSAGNGGGDEPALGVSSNGLDFLSSTTDFGSFGFGLGQFDYGFQEDHPEGSFQIMLPSDQYQSAEKNGES